MGKKMTSCACLQNELARLRRDAAQRAAAAAQHQRAAASVAQSVSQAAAWNADRRTPAVAANGVAAPPVVSEQLLRSLKVSWYLKVSMREHACIWCSCGAAPASNRHMAPAMVSSRFELTHVTEGAGCMKPRCTANLAIAGAGYTCHMLSSIRLTMRHLFLAVS